MGLFALGILAGLLTTVAGLGGGMLLLLALAFVRGPQAALAVTAPALLLGNLHRALLFRRTIRLPVALPLVLATLPGSLLGGLLLPVLPGRWVHAIMVVMTALAVARSLGWWRWTPSPAALAPAGFGIGALAATSGGAGLLLAPLLLATGLTGEAYVATGAAVAVAMHLGRVLAYGAGGLLAHDTLGDSAVLAVALLLGNALGQQARSWIPDTLGGRLEMATLVVSVLLVVAGARG